ncbi:MAG: gliding motility-associated C-terminal domain-containing protein [Candidatus Cloacimonetes bacterium]|nr:gliding motility-associated C-terminal domain-containing protein [Candidatus Cloacimonadota bacterium]
MKKYMILVGLSLILCCLNAQRNWQSFTNTKNMRQAIEYKNDIVIATSGGVEFFNPETASFIKTLTNIDGLSGIDIRVIDKYNDEMLIAVNSIGIDRYKNDEFQISLNQALGLSSLDINSIYSNENTIFVCTAGGLITFDNDESYPFPLFENLYTASDGLNSDFVNTILIDDDNYLFVGTDKGLNKVHLDSLYINDAWETYSFGFNIPVNSIDLNDTHILLGTTNGVYKIERQNFGDPTSYTNYFSQTNINQTFFYQDKIYAVFGKWDNNAGEYRGDSQNRALGIIGDNDIDLIYFNDNEKIKKPITNILVYDNNLIATSWGEGLYIYYNEFEEWENYKPNCIFNSTISKITIDNTGNVWFGDGLIEGELVAGLMTGVSKLDSQNMQWSHYGVENSGLHSNNIVSIGVDSDNRKWFGSWYTSVVENGETIVWKGISILDDSDVNNPQWTSITPSNTNPYLYTDTIADLESVGDKMYVTSYDGGVNVMNSDLQVEHKFEPPFSYERNIVKTYFTGNQTFLGSYDSGIIYWDSADLPQTNGSFWKRPVASELTTNCYVKDIDSWTDNYSTKVWFATSKGIYMMEKTSYDTSWYKIDIDIKRRKFIDGSFQNETLYYVDEERIWGSDITSPTCLLIDPFGRVWMGSEDKGISMYDMQEDRFYNYKTKNSPLISDKITDLAYQASTGFLYIGTDSGLSIVEIGKTEKTTRKLGKIAVWPNPFKPDKDKALTIRNIDYESMPIGENECRIFDISGQLVVTLSENRFMEFTWNGNNEAGKKCSSGLYFYLIKTEAGDSANGKIVLIR